MNRAMPNVNADGLMPKCRASTNTDSEMFLPLKGLQGYRVLDIPLHSIICFDFGHANGNPSLFAMTSDKAHHQARRVVNHVYSLANVLKSEVYIDKCSELFLRRLREHAENAEPVIDLGRWLQMYAFDVIGELYFGNMFGFLEQSHDRCRWIQSLDLLQPFMCTSAVAPRLFQPLLLASSSFVPAAREAMKAFEEIGVSTRGCVAKRFELGNKIESEAHKRTDIMQQLYDIHLKKGSEVQFGMGEIEQEAYSAFFAGSDTTATGFRSIVYHLMKNREAYQQVQQEIDEAFEQGRLSEPVKFSETLKLPFLCATIKEALRIHPGVQLSMGRVVSTEGMVLCGSFIPGGYWVGMNAAVVQLDVSIFGHDADQFRPARWLEPEATNMDKHMLVFGAGTRTCIGKNISLAELHKLTPAILRHFDLELVEEHSTWKTKNYNLCKQDLGPVRLRRRLLR